MTDKVEAIFISAKKGDHPHAVESAAAVAGKGLEGNRYFDTGRPEQELTLIEAEQLEYAPAEHGLEIDAAASGRNIVTRGVDLNALVGQALPRGRAASAAGSISASRARRCEARTAPGAIKALVHRAGLNAEILVGGELRPGDA